jgi:hypothetical protein
MPFAIPTNHRPCNAIGRVSEVQAITPFDAEVSFVDWCIHHGARRDKSALPSADEHFASRTAIGADGADLQLPRAGGQHAFVGQCAGRTGVHAGAAAHAVAVSQVGLVGRPDFGAIAAVPCAPHVIAGYFVADAYAPKARNALRHVYMDAGVGIVNLACVGVTA